MRNTSKSSSFIRSLTYVKNYWALVVVTLFLSLVFVASSLLLPIIIGSAIDKMVYGTLFLNNVKKILLTSAVVALIGGLSQWLMGVINNRITYLVVRDMRRDAFKKIQALPVSYLDKHPVGDILSRITSDIDTFSDGLLMGFTQLFTGVLTIVATLVFMVVINPFIALTVFLLTPVSLLIASFIAKRTHKFFAEQTKIRGRQTDYINEMIGNLKTVKAFSYEQNAINSFDEINEKHNKTALNAVFFSSLVNPTTRFINSLVYASVAGVGALFAAGFSFAGVFAITVGELTVLLSYVNQYTKPFNEISGVVAELQNAVACADRFFDLMNEKEIDNQSENKEFPKAVKGDVKISNVSFSYTQDKPLIKNFNLNVKSGSKIAIVGPTGCGKTTLINLLMRFYDVDSGSIMIDGTDIRSISFKALRQNYGMVLQDTWLKYGTVRENLKLGRPEATDEEMIEAAKKVHCHGFISRMEHGYDTVIDEAGGMLSGGQKQLICIARAMISNPPILILDEATSSIDTRTERRVQKAMVDLMEGRTSFVVAHRLSTIKDVDTILVMNDGNVVEQGNHNQLMEKKGFYYDLFNSQYAD